MDLRKTPNDGISTEKSHQLVSLFENTLKKTFDCGGKMVAEKKENKSAMEFVEDQVNHVQKNTTNVYRICC